MKIFKTLLGLFLLLTAFETKAGLRFSFNLDYCSWKATHIVIVSEGEEIDGQVMVQESLKGDLISGETLTIPKFAVFKNRLLRKVGIDVEVLKAYNSKAKSNRNSPINDIENDSEYLQEENRNSSYITCTRMMLFLIKSENNSEVSWKPVSDYDGFFLSTIWIEPETSFVFYQRISDEPNALLPMQMQEDKIKEHVFELMELRAFFDRAITMNDAGNKAEALLPAARSSILFIKNSAFDEINKCGKPALPVLRTMMKDLSVIGNSRYIFEAIGKFGDAQIGNELAAIITEELEFWKQTAPQLKINWWNKHSDPQTENLRSRYDRAYYAIIALRRLKFAGCKEAIIEFRDFWRSQPLLENNDDLKQMSMECDRTLETLNWQ